ncbi:MAG: FISUMP domain-containing protein [Ignavibacteriaceae bacterium]|nr:FISUMP domain-containing protein [Ignavibacteriaceae bacterium]
MKKIILLLIVSLIIFNSCKKDSNPVNPEISTTPILVSPINNATNVSTSLSVSWNAIAGAAGYNLRVATDSIFSGITLIKDSIQTLSYQISGLGNATSYYWKVSAIIDTGTSGWSETWKFTTGSAPDAPALSSPSNNSTSVFLPPTFYWHSIPGAKSYTLQVATNTAFTLFAFDQSNIQDTSFQVTGLKGLTQYYWRVSATNDLGTSGWSAPYFEFTTASGSNTGTACPGLPTITYEDQTYHTVQIGSQCWLKENLNVGTMITDTHNQTNNSIIEKFCYQDNALNCVLYGGLYQWGEAMAYNSRGNNVQGICPNGWHIPTNTEFSTLAVSVNNNGNAIKAVLQGTGAGAGTDSSGFSALLTGYHGAQAGYFDLGFYTNFWTSMDSDSTNAIVMWLWGGDSAINMNPTGNNNTGISLRCIKN